MLISPPSCQYLQQAKGKFKTPYGIMERFNSVEKELGIGYTLANAL
jgi:hypothetical protein